MKFIFEQHATCFYTSENRGKPMYIRSGGDDRKYNGGFTTYATLGNFLKAVQRFEKKVGYAPTRLTEEA